MSTEDNPAIISVKTTVRAPAENARKIWSDPSSAQISLVSDTVSSARKKKINTH